MKKSRLFALLLAAALVLSMLAGCGNNNTTTPPADDQSNTTPDNTPTTPDEPVTTGEKVYRTYLASECSMLNAHDNVDTNVSTPYSYTNSTLWRAVPNDDGKGYHYVGDLATDLPVIVDQTKGTDEEGNEVVETTTWEFKIREEAKWHNGDPINADTLVYSYKMQIDPVLVNKMANFLYDYSITIVNGEAYFNGECDWEDVGIKKIDDYTMQIITVGEPTLNDFCSHFTDRSCYPVHEATYEAGMNADRTETTFGTDLDSYVGCGPYFFDSWTRDSVQVYKKNPDHWLADLFNYDTVEVYIIPEMNARVQMFESGKLDDLIPDSNTIETYIDDPRMVSYASTTIEHIDINCLNTNNPISTSVNYRKAIYHAIDRETLAASAFGYMEPAGHYVNGMAGILSESGIPYRETKYGKATTDLIASWSAEGHTTGYNPELALEYLKKAYDECNVSYDTKIELIMAFDASSSSWKACGEFLQQEFPKIFNDMLSIKIVNYSGISTTEFKKGNETGWDLSPNDWSRGVSRNYPHTCFYYYLSTYSSHPNNYFSSAFEEQYAVCESLRNDYEAMIAATQVLEELYLAEVIQCPVIQDVNYQMFSDRLEVPVDNYIPGFGWGTMYGDIIGE